MDFEPKMNPDEPTSATPSTNPDAPDIRHADPFIPNKIGFMKNNLKWDIIRYNPNKAMNSNFLTKDMVRLGVPDDLRAAVWSKFLGSYELKCSLPTKYCEYVDQAKHMTSAEALHQIDLDITRTFPSHKLYQSIEGVQRLRRVLRAFTVYHPQICYCQALNFLAGLFLIYMEEDLAFWSLVQMVCSTTKKGMNISDYYTEHLLGLKRDIKTLQYLMKRHTSKALALLRAEKIELDWICAEWFLCSFATTLPMSVTLRIWDTLLNEGTKVYFRVSLALFKRFEQKAPHPCTFDSIVQYFKSEIKVQEICPNAFIHMAFHGIGTLKRCSIYRLQTKAAREVNQCMLQEALEREKRAAQLQKEQANREVYESVSDVSDNCVIPLITLKLRLDRTSTIPYEYQSPTLEEN